MKAVIILAFLAFLLAGILNFFHIGGILIIFAVLILVYTLPRRGVDPSRAIRLTKFLVDFIWDVIVCNVRMLWDVITVEDKHRIRLVKVPISDMNDYEITLLNHRINLSPGTLVCRIDIEEGYLLVHDMYGTGEKRGQDLRGPIDILRGKM